MAFLAVANVKESGEWKNVDSSHALRTRDIIRYWNTHFNENISDSSYDDMRVFLTAKHFDNLHQI